MSLKGWLGGVFTKAKQNAPALLTATGIGLMFTSTALAVRGTPGAMESIDKKKQEEGHDRLTFAQTIEATWRHYLWALAAFTGGSICLVASLKEGNKRIAALMATADAGRNLLQEFNDYRRFVAERIGEKKEAEVYNQTMQEMVNRNPPPAQMAADRTMVDGEAPKPMCCDKFSQRYFWKDYETVAAAVNRLNYEINNGLNGYVSLNDFYTEIDVGRSDVGDRLGWSIETGLIEIPEKEHLQYAGTPSGWPCWILEFVNPPQYDYQFFRSH